MNRPVLVDSILGLIGHTPLVRLDRIARAVHGRSAAKAATLWAKCEMANPGGSVKDRIALAMIEAAERAGKIRPGESTLVEPTSGNTGIGLAMVAAAKGYKLILTMPDDYSLERRKLVQRFGAQLILTPAIEGMTGAVFAAEELVAKNKNYFMPQQFKNPANPEIHLETTAEEIWNDTDGEVDILVSGVGMIVL